MNQLRQLHLSRTLITDVGLSHLEDLKRLQWLHLARVQITGAGLTHLQRLPQLERLYLSDTKITDGCLAHLKELKSLERLHLRGTNITDASLAHLSALSQLRELDLGNTKLSVGTVDDLQKMLPICQIVRPSRDVAKRSSNYSAMQESGSFFGALCILVMLLFKWGVFSPDTDCESAYDNYQELVAEIEVEANYVVEKETYMEMCGGLSAEGQECLSKAKMASAFAACFELDNDKKSDGSVP
jgi:hypothetical protein